MTSRKDKIAPNMRTIAFMLLALTALAPAGFRLKAEAARDGTFRLKAEATRDETFRLKAEATETRRSA